MHKRLSAQFDIMKLAKLTYLPFIGLTLALAAAGCHKGLDKTTQIPGQKYGAPTDKPAEPRDMAQGNALPPGGERPGTDKPIAEVIPPGKEGIPLSGVDRSGWKENREEFAAQTVHFDYDKSNVKPSEVGKLEEVARRMKGNFQGKALRIEGHCDERGTEEYNRALGDRRALSVREKLAALGLDPGILDTITFGEEKPADAGHTEAAWRKNRRAELILLSPP
jgi:peptidoglycan-associated lipoprotein